MRMLTNGSRFERQPRRHEMVYASYDPKSKNTPSSSYSRAAMCTITMYNSTDLHKNNFHHRMNGNATRRLMP